MAETHQPLWLLLLPSPTSSISLTTLKAEYGPPLTHALRKASNESKAFSATTMLDLAIDCSKFLRGKNNPRTHEYARLQDLLGQVYTLICLVCAEESIDIRYGNEIDARVLLIEKTGTSTMQDADSQDVDLQDGNALFEGPILSLQALALCHRPWQRLCAIESVNGEVLLQAFLRIQNALPYGTRKTPSIQRFQSGRVTAQSGQSLSQKTDPAEDHRRRHYSVAVGGTFDHLHAGHKLLLTMTALVLEPNAGSEMPQQRTLTVGITGDDLLVKKQFKDEIQDWDERQAHVRQFLVALLELSWPTHLLTSTTDVSGVAGEGRAVHDKLKSGLIIRYVELFDAFGPTITDKTISALIVSGETRAGGKAVNDQRKGKGWAPLEVFEVDVLSAKEGDYTHSGHSDPDGESFQGKISSTEIRRRLHDRHAIESATAG